MALQERYINPFTDFGFKKLFGTEPNKDLLIDFLNQLLPSYHKIEKLTYSDKEYLGSSSYDRKAIFDIFCTNEKGEKFIVEIQKAKQNYFKDRSVYYSTFPIQEQAIKGEWDYKLSAVYTVGILDFVFDEDKYNADVMHFVQLKNQHNNIFYDKLTYIYLEMPKFNKSEDELETDFDKWMFVFKNLHLLDKMPSRLQNKIFTKLFGEAELANLQATDRAAYEESLKIYRDLKNVTDTAYDQGFKEASDILNEKIAKEQLLKEEERKLKEEERKLKEEEQRQKETIINAFYQTGKSAEDIATLLGIPVDSILSIIHKKGDF